MKSIHKEPKLKKKKERDCANRSKSSLSKGSCDTGSVCFLNNPWCPSACVWLQCRSKAATVFLFFSFLKRVAQYTSSLWYLGYTFARKRSLGFLWRLYRSFLVPNYSSASFFPLHFHCRLLSGSFFAVALPLTVRCLAEGHLEGFFYFSFPNGFISSSATILLANSAIQSSWSMGFCSLAVKLFKSLSPSRSHPYASRGGAPTLVSAKAKR